MNCRPGELAVIVMCPPSTEHLIGKIIRVTTLAPPRVEQPKHYSRPDYAARWHYEGPRMLTARGTKIEWVNDCCLRPLRGDETADEDVKQLELLDA